MKLLKYSIAFSLASLLFLSGCNSGEDVSNQQQESANSLYGATQDDKNALIILFDRAGLNITCDSTFQNNKSQLFNLLSKQSLSDMNINSLHIIAFDDELTDLVLFTDKQARVRKFVKLVNANHEDINKELGQISKDSAKDVYFALQHVHDVINSKYSDYTNVGVAIFSNMRQSVNQHLMKDIESIKFNANTIVKVFMKSGTECQNATINQSITAERKEMTFWKNKLFPSSHIILTTKY